MPADAPANSSPWPTLAATAVFLLAFFGFVQYSWVRDHRKREMTR